jgi:hypothetical protein
MTEDFPYLNGTVWQTKNGLMWRVLTYLHEDAWVLMAFGRSAAGFPACVMTAQSDESGRWGYSRHELPERLKNWECIGYWKGQELPEHCWPERPTVQS